MISRLININVLPITEKISQKDLPLKTNFSIKDYVQSFLLGMGETQRERFKKMIEYNIPAGMSVAKSYGIDYKEFISEVKNQLNIN